MAKWQLSRIAKYNLGLTVAKCGCRFMVGDTAVGQEIEPGIFELVARIPELGPPETPTVWAREHVIAPHAEACLEFRPEDERSE